MNPMNTVIAFPANKPELKLSSHPVTSEERRRFDDDMEILRQREANLRDYEARLRTWQERIEQGQGQSNPPQFVAPASLAHTPSGTPFESEVLNVAWDKLIRARELLEAEQAHLRDDRLNLKEANAALKRREDALLLREARLMQREEQVNAAMEATIAEQTKASTLTRLTQAPFAIAKSVFSHSKSKSE